MVQLEERFNIVTVYKIKMSETRSCGKLRAITTRSCKVVFGEEVTFHWVPLTAHPNKKGDISRILPIKARSDLNNGEPWLPVFWACNFCDFDELFGEFVGLESDSLIDA